MNKYDIIKGLGILLVVAGHVFHESSPQPVFVIYLFHMPLFFFLSGYLFKARPEGEYLGKKTVHLIVPYVVFLSVLLALSVAKSVLIEHESTVEIFKKIGLTAYGGEMLKGETGVFWFVTCLFFTQQVYNLLANRFSGAIHWLVLGCYVVASVNSYFKTPFPFPLAINVSLIAIAYFHLGKCFSAKDVFSSKGGKTMLWVVVALVVAVLGAVIRLSEVNLGVNMKYSDYGLPVLNVLFPLAFIFLIFRLSQLLESMALFRKTLGYLGSASMTIMFLHQFFNYAVAPRVGLGGNNAAIFILCLVGSLIAHEVISRIALFRLLFAGDYQVYQKLTSKLRKSPSASSVG